MRRRVVGLWAGCPAFGGSADASSGRRLDELDGLRGWAALSVVLFHVYWETFANIVPGLRNPITGFCLDGSLAVYIFFVLSGEALSSAYLSGKGDRAVFKLALKRYPRLAIPILAACLVVLVLSRCGLVFNVEAGAILGHSKWLTPWLQPTPTAISIVKYALVTVFTTTDPTRAVIPFLWTMRIELLGSVLVFSLLLLSKFWRDPRLVLIGLGLILLATPGVLANGLSCFVAGILFADIRVHGGFACVGGSRLKVVAWLVLAAVVIFDGVQRTMGYDACKHILAILLIGAVFSTPSISRFFATGPSRLLGRLSFSLYLMQFPVIVSLTSWLIIYAARHEALTAPIALGIATISWIACLIAAVLFEPVELFTKYVGRRLVAIFMAPSRHPAAPSDADDRRRWTVASALAAGRRRVPRQM